MSSNCIVIDTWKCEKNFVLADVLLVEAVYVKNMVKIMGSQDFTVM